jgi:hypothetical protein
MQLGLCKGVLPLITYSRKRTKNKFRESVKKSISRDIMTIEQQRMFSRRAQQYMLAYHAIDKNNNNNNNNESNVAPTAATTGDTTTNKDKKTTFALIASIIKNYKHTYKTHRSVADSDTGYINQVVSAMKMALFISKQQQGEREQQEGSNQQQQQNEQERTSRATSG